MKPAVPASTLVCLSMAVQGCRQLLSPQRDIYGSLAVGVLSVDVNGARRPLSSKEKISSATSNAGGETICNADFRVCNFSFTSTSQAAFWR